MSTVNHYIKDFLEYYIGLDQPQYAVLLSGKWGSGKTHFIERFKSEYTNIRVVKISLFGLKSKEDIHKKIVLEQFTFPKTSESIAKNLNSVLEKFTGVNLNLTLSDISVESAIKQIGKKKTIFVFDDLERMEMSFSEAFGYINQLVEDYGQKVIFIADDTHLKDREDYQQFKEKIIGKTFQIEQDFDIAFTAFLYELKNSKVILQNNQSVVKTVFDMAGYKNLRSLRQGMLDFDRLMDSFEDKFKNHTELMMKIIQIFFALAFEIKSGKHKIPSPKISYKEQMDQVYFSEKEEQKNFIDYIVEEYDFDHSVLPNDMWLKYLSNQYLAPQEVTKSLNNSRFFLEEQREEWIKLWYYRQLEDTDYESALTNVLSKLRNDEYLEPEKCLHVAGILLRLSEKKLYNPSFRTPFLAINFGVVMR